VTKRLITTLTTILLGVLATAPVSQAFPRFYTDSSMTTPLRGTLTSTPRLQPDALEFNNQGAVELQLGPAGTPPVVCKELEFGTTPVINNGFLQTRLALPFGVAEGDTCVGVSSAGTSITVPIYFDTLPTGAVPAFITVTGGPPFVATFHRLRLSVDREGQFCTANLEGVTGEFFNVTGGFVEEAPPNLLLVIKFAPISVACEGAVTTGHITALFYLESMSTTTDTAFIG
jgi:hypothetical protein